MYICTGINRTNFMNVYSRQLNCPSPGANRNVPYLIWMRFDFDTVGRKSRFSPKFSAYLEDTPYMTVVIEATRTCETALTL